MKQTIKTKDALEMANSDARWAAVVERRADVGESFFYSVRTTGVYCRPTCGSRRPRRDNVEFHNTRGDAERAGFRPCKRCRPDQGTASPHLRRITAACRSIVGATEPRPLKELAKEAGLSPYYFQRLFKTMTGLTPLQFAAAHRENRLRDALRNNSTVTEAIYGAGYNSSGRFYAKADQALGMTPSEYRAGGRDTTIRFAIGDCSLGSILVAQSDRGVCAILLGSDPGVLLRELEDAFPRANLIGGDNTFEQVVANVVGLVEAPGQGSELPLDIRGTAFQRRVWQAIQQIPAGTTVSYTELAASIGAPKSVRAVARACGANLLAVAIPCHRVVRLDGGLSGYRWGIERKRALLSGEEASMEGPTDRKAR